MGKVAERAQVIVRGVVQGVGFRPYVYSLANSFDLKGYVSNTADGVLIDVEGTRISDFLDLLPKQAPSLSRIADIFVTHLPLCGHTEFVIKESREESGNRLFTLVSPDVSVCQDCLAEMLDPCDRRHLYPFINCTNCGPRYSITKSVPYDRINTTMSAFSMCSECLREYQDPKDRRFHAQPNACPRCGPEIEFRHAGSGQSAKGEAALDECIRMLQEGGIVAIKGLGGFHIACDAANDNTVRRLRERKRKSNKPFAVMAPDVDTARMFCVISCKEEAILKDNRRPIVLLQKRQDAAAAISGAVSPNNRCLGVVLPYTPLHYLLFYYAKRQAPIFHALVMTSGNLSEEPIVRDNNEALKKLSSIVDGFLLHNRDIFMRVDDSVIRVQSSEFNVQSRRRYNPGDSESGEVDLGVFFIRRSRGYAPEPIRLHDDGPEVLGCGADLKNTFTLTKGCYAIPSQHIGDMENYETLRFYEECLENLKTVYRVRPEAIVHDLHPGYLSTQWALRQGQRLYGIQHHYAHIGSVMAEHDLRGPVIGVAFDGTGYGTDGRLWGGEFLIADISGFERKAQFKYIPLPGGEAAIREPWRTAVSYIMDAAGERSFEHLERIGFIERYGRDAIEQTMTIARRPELAPLSSGAGRLFDAVSAMLGICGINTFEGEAAMALELLVMDGVETEYPAVLKAEDGYTIIDFSSVITAILQDIADEIDSKTVSTRFHNTIASVIRVVVMELSKRYGIRDVVLSGGTFQNMYITAQTCKLIECDTDLSVYMNHKVPSNDAGISLGQAYIVRERLQRR